MGRVSRMLKAISDKPSTTGDNGPMAAASDPDLPRIIACWTHMPASYKQTIMSLVEQVELKRRQAQRKAESP